MTMIDELLLHIGPIKTATTSIQEALAATAKEQAALGTFIPLARGSTPGQHAPILRELVGDAEYRNRYSFSQDEISLAETMRAAADAGCTRLLISAEQFAAPDATEDVYRLLDAIGPRRFVVLRIVRPVAHWLLSVYAQFIKYGLSELSTWPVGPFADWFAEAVLPASVSAIERWRDGPWSTSVRTMFLPPTIRFDVTGMFARVAELPVPLGARKSANERLGPCDLRVLQALNLLTFDDTSTIGDSALRREPVLASLLRHGTPAHACSCAQRLSSDCIDFVKGRATALAPTLVKTSDVIHGDPAWPAADIPGTDLVHPRFPEEDSAALVVRLMGWAIDETLKNLEAVTEARDFWHRQSEAWMEQAKA
jgi:hypothetical protein